MQDELNEDDSIACSQSSNRVGNRLVLHLHNLKSLKDLRPSSCLTTLYDHHLREDFKYFREIWLENKKFNSSNSLNLFFLL